MIWNLNEFEELLNKTDYFFVSGKEEMHIEGNVGTLKEIQKKVNVELPFIKTILYKNKLSLINEALQKKTEVSDYDKIIEYILENKIEKFEKFIKKNNFGKIEKIISNENIEAKKIIKKFLKNEGIPKKIKNLLKKIKETKKNRTKKQIKKIEENLDENGLAIL